MSEENLFIKENSSSWKDALIRESEGLALLRKSLTQSGNSLLNIPEVFSVDDRALKVELIKSCRPDNIHWENLGKGLAKLHVIEQKSFGYREDNHIGLNPQKNILSENWGLFFVEYRLGFQVNLITSDLIKERFSRILDRVSQPMAEYLNEHSSHASLVHGDLWSGNVMFSKTADERHVWLIDPAVYFADREVDIAMTEMFGGFDLKFYDSYQEIFPLSSEYPKKKIIYNLYHYLNHYNLFGGGYLGACETGFEVLAHQFDSALL